MTTRLSKLTAQLPDKSSTTIYVKQESIPLIKQLASDEFKGTSLDLRTIKWTEEPAKVNTPTKIWWQPIKQLAIRYMSAKFREAKATMKDSRKKSENPKKEIRGEQERDSHPKTTRSSSLSKSTKPQTSQRPADNPLVIPKEARGVVKEANELLVNDNASLQTSTELIGRLKALIKKIEEDFEPQLKAARDTVAKIKDARDQKTAQLEDVIVILRGKNDKFNAAQKVSAAKAAEIANRAAQKREQKERREKAAELVIEGKADEAKRLLEAPSDVQEIKPEIFTPNGATPQKRWRWGLKDIKQVNPDYLTTKDGAITALVRQMGRADASRRKEIQMLLGEGIVMEEYDLTAYGTAEVEEEIITEA